MWIHRLLYSPNIIVHCLTTSSNCLHRLQIRLLMLSVRKSLQYHRICWKGWRPFGSECRTNCQVLKVNNPILSDIDMIKIKELHQEGLKVAEVSTLFYKSTKLERAIDRLFVEVDKAYRDGAILWYFQIVG